MHVVKMLFIERIAYYRYSFMNQSNLAVCQCPGHRNLMHAINTFQSSRKFPVKKPLPLVLIALKRTVQSSYHPINTGHDYYIQITVPVHNIQTGDIITKLFSNNLSPSSCYYS